MQNSNRTSKLGNSAAFLSKQLRASGWVVPRRTRVSSVAWAWTSHHYPWTPWTVSQLVQLHLLQNHAYHTSYISNDPLHGPFCDCSTGYRLILCLVTDSQFWPLLTPILPKGSLFGAGAICSLPSAHRSWPERQARGTYSKVPGILSHTLNPFKFQSCRMCVCVCYRYMCNQNYMHLSRPESAVDLHSFCHRPWTLYPVFATSLAVATSLTSKINLSTVQTGSAAKLMRHEKWREVKWEKALVQGQASHTPCWPRFLKPESIAVSDAHV